VFTFIRAGMPGTKARLGCALTITHARLPKLDFVRKDGGADAANVSIAD
jgi:hypothetical protein